MKLLFEILIKLPQRKYDTELKLIIHDIFFFPFSQLQLVNVKLI